MSFLLLHISRPDNAANLSRRKFTVEKYRFRVDASIRQTKFLATPEFCFWKTHCMKVLLHSYESLCHLQSSVKRGEERFFSCTLIQTKNTKLVVIRYNFGSAAITYSDIDGWRTCPHFLLIFFKNPGSNETSGYNCFNIPSGT